MLLGKQRVVDEILVSLECLVTTVTVSRGKCGLDLGPVGGWVRDDESERQRRRGTRTPSLFSIIGVVVGARRLGILQARVGLGACIQ